MSAEIYRSKNHRMLEVGLQTWKLFQSIGRSYGWKPEGTVPDIESGKHWISNESKRDLRIRYDYKCEDMYWSKMVTAKDAYSWAEALSKFMDDAKAGKVVMHPSTLSSGPLVLDDSMTPEDFKRLNNPDFVNEVERFINFLIKGHFCFSWDD